MTTQTTLDVREVPRISRSEAPALATAHYDRLLDLLAELSPQEWSAPTDCTGWDVAAMTGHLIGAAKGHASLRESLRQQRYGKRHKADFGGNEMDAFNDLQVRDHADLTPEQRLAELRRVAPRAVRGRARFPGLLRRRDIPIDVGGSTAAGMPPTLNLGHLMDVVLTRDVWLHRVDVARATGRQVDTDSDADRRLVADVVAEWADRHGEPFRLELTGPAGGRFTAGGTGPQWSMDAVEFCRALSGRCSAPELPPQRVLF